MALSVRIIFGQLLWYIFAKIVDLFRDNFELLMESSKYVTDRLRQAADIL